MVLRERSGQVVASGDVMKRVRYIAGVLCTLPCLAAAIFCVLVGAIGWAVRLAEPFRRAVERTWTSDGFMVAVGSQVVCWVGYAWEQASVVAVSSGHEESKRHVFWAATSTSGKLVDLSVRDEGSAWFYVAGPPVPWTSPEVGARVVAQTMKRELKVVCRDKADGCLAIFESDPSIKVRLRREDEMTGRWFRVVNPLKEVRA